MEIDQIENNLPVVVSPVKRKPTLERLADKEDVFQHSMFEYYTKVYSENPGMKGHRHYEIVADHFKKDISEIVFTAKKFAWLVRARKLFIGMKAKGESANALPTEATDIIKDIVSNSHTIAKLGTKLISEYLVSVDTKLLKPHDVFKLGMLVVECVRVTHEVLGGTSGQSQGQTIQLVINE